MIRLSPHYPSEFSELGTPGGPEVEKEEDLVEEDVEVGRGRYVEGVPLRRSRSRIQNLQSAGSLTSLRTARQEVLNLPSTPHLAGSGTNAGSIGAESRRTRGFGSKVDELEQKVISLEGTLGLKNKLIDNLSS